MDQVFQKMEGGNAAIAMYYAGDYLTMLDNNEDLAFVVPDEGSNWFVDAMCVLKTSPHKAEAEAWINFIASTESNLANMDYIWYASPNAEALADYPRYYQDLYDEELDEEIYEIMAPGEDVLERYEIYENLPTKTLQLYNDLWNELGVSERSDSPPTGLIIVAVLLLLAILCAVFLRFNKRRRSQNNRKRVNR